jgi:hypothetical protein
VFIFHWVANGFSKSSDSGSMAWHKTCLVVRRLSQVEGTHFNETFSIIQWMGSTQTMHAIAIIQNHVY